ncbi:MAG: phosphoglycerate kinase [Proteobacteria bacterium]|nr:phosphoglycerate kinase [Pseudomonadota bacterium]MBU1611706.1 phosphoglycerate kinase [Pseudomonadota bacterium]
MKFIDDLDLTGKKLLIRVDYNVPLDGETITDDNRITASLPTLKYALGHGAAIIICAHLGKPKGKVVPELTLKPVAAHLSKLLGLDVVLAPDSVGPEVEAMAKALKIGQVMMLENLRFHAHETGKTIADRGEHGLRLAAMADIYVNDAFGVAHRENASVVDVPKYAKACCGGFLIKKEFEYLGTALRAPARPFVTISGGSKVSSKLGILNNLLGKVDDLIIGGAMANTFLLAQGYSMGKSLVEPDLVDTAIKIMNAAQAKGTNIHLPSDFLYGTNVDVVTSSGTCLCSAVPDDAMVLDIGPKTIKSFCAILGDAKTVVWNGPMGLFETPAFATGSLEICKCLAELQDCVTIVGGGDTDAVVHHAGLIDKITFISTGGGSFMEFLEGKELPGFKALKECSE